eukprot:jgi/Chlat1/5547/Chrsp369S00840
MAGAGAPSTWMRGTVKAVPSGDSLVIIGNVRGGPPPEKTITLTGLIAPRMARRDGTSRDEPWAWQSKEYLRRRCIGKQVTFRVDYAVPTIGREFGTVYLAEGNVNVGHDVVEHGWAKVREQRDAEAAQYEELLRLQDVAQQAGSGIWSKEPGAAEASVRKLPGAAGSEGSTFDALELLASYKGKPLAAIVESVRDGAFLRAWLLPEMQFVAIYLAGIQAPSMGKKAQPAAPAVSEGGQDTNGKPTTSGASEPGAPLSSAQRLASSINSDTAAEPYAREAKHYAECRILHRDVRVVLEGVDKYQNLFGSVFYPEDDQPRDIAEELLKQGLVKMVDWSAAMLPLEVRTKLRAAERAAKQAQLCLWRNYVPPPSNSTAILNDNFTGRVVEVISGDIIVVRDLSLPPGPQAERRVALSSIRAPRMGNPRREERAAPYAREAKEFLRQRLIGKEVHVTMEYTRKVTAAEGAPALPGGDRDMAFGSMFLPLPDKERTDAANGQSLGANVAEMLIVRGLATVVRHREQEERSLHYDQLLAAEAKAQKDKKGLHSAKEPPSGLINDVSQNAANRAKQYLPFFQRTGRVSAVVEYVLSGHRYKLFIPKESCGIAFSLSGVRCPGKDEPYAEEALQFMRHKILQHDVEVEIESIDKTGTFLGRLFLNRTNVGVELLSNGLATLHPSFSADRVPGGNELMAAEALAKKQRVNIWQNYVEPVAGEGDDSASGDVGNRNKEMLRVRVSEIKDATEFYVQKITGEPQLPWLEEQLRSLSLDLAEKLPPVMFDPKRGDIVLGRFTGDDNWARAYVESVLRDASGLKINTKYEVFYLDYGNRETLAFSRLRPLEVSANLGAVPQQAQLCQLAFLKVPKLDEDFGMDAANLFGRLVAGKELTACVEEVDRTGGKQGSKLMVTLVVPGLQETVNIALLKNGLARLEKARGTGWRAQEIKKLLEHQDQARQSRLNLWQYGDIDSEEDEPANAWGAKRR